jgi:hypothetical protein
MANPWDSDPVVSPAPAASPWISDPVVSPAPATTPAPPLPQHPVAGPSGSDATDWSRRLGTAGTDALGALLSFPRTVAGGVDWLGNKAGMNIGAEPALASVQQPGGGQLFPDYATAKEMAYKTTGATEYAPATALGRYAQGGLDAGALALAGNPKAILPAVFGGGAGEAAAELFPEHPFLARTLAFLTGSHLATSAVNTTAKQIGMQTGLAQPSDLYQSYERQGVPITTNADAASSAWQTAAENAATKLGPSATTADAGQGLQTAAQQWLSDFRQNADGKWTAFRGQVPSNTQIPVTGFQTALQGVNQDFGGADNLAKALQPGLAAKLQTALNQDISPNGTLPWQAVQSTRTALGEMLASGQPIADTTQAAIKRLYAGLSDDMRTGANSAGPAASRAFNDANGYTANGHALLDAGVGRILNAPSPEAAAQYALAQIRQGGSRLGAINWATQGQGGSDLGAATIRQASENGPDALVRRVGTISPAAQTQLFGGAQQDVGDLVDVAKSLRQTGAQYAAHAPSDTSRWVGALEGYRLGHEWTGSPYGGVAGAGVGLVAPGVISAVPRTFASNRLMSQIYQPQVSPFAGPTRLNALLQAQQQDQRSVVPQNARRP